MKRLSGDPPKPQLPPEPLTGEEMVAAQDRQRVRRWWIAWRLLCLGLLASAIVYPLATGVPPPVGYYFMLALAWMLLVIDDGAR